MLHNFSVALLHSFVELNLSKIAVTLANGQIDIQTSQATFPFQEAFHKKGPGQS